MPLARLLPEIAPAEATSTGPGDPALLFQTVMRVVQLLARVQPLVLLLEDVHWSDEMSVRRVLYVFRQLRTDRVFVLTTVREEETATVPLLAETVGELVRANQFVGIDLAPLSRGEPAVLLERLVPPGTVTGGAVGVEAEVWQATAGHPFMIVEIAQLLGARGTGAGGEALPLPASVHGFVFARLHRLSDRGRGLAEVAAVRSMNAQRWLEVCPELSPGRALTRSRRSANFSPPT